MNSADGRFRYCDKDGDPLPDGSTIQQVGRIEFKCRQPHPGDGWCGVNVSNAGYNIPNRNWALTGTVDHPTLKPSINCERCWHGHIEAGVYVNCAKQPEEKQ